MRSRRTNSTTRIQALGTLLGLVVAIVLGALHPLADAPEEHATHACHADGTLHLDAPAEHDHQHSGCALCALAEILGGAPVPAGPQGPLAKLPLACPQPACDARPERQAHFSFSARGPPAA